MPMRCTTWQVETIVKIKVDGNMNMHLGTHFKMSRPRRWYGTDTLSRSPSCFIPTEARLVPRSVRSDVGNKQYHAVKGFRPTSSWRRAIDIGSGTFRGSHRKSLRSIMDLFAPPTFPRQLSTSSDTAVSRAGVTHSIRETRTGNTTGTIATVTISNPARMNIVNSQILDQLVNTCRELSKAESLRVAVLTGGLTAEGKSPSFIGGADIKEMNALSSSEDAKTFINKIHYACQALRELPVPVIARVHGFSLGAGLEIMAACDLRLATRNSIFGMPEVKVGIPSVIEAAYLPGLIGMGRTRRLLYLAENISAQEAFECGLVEKVVDDEVALDSAVEEWTKTIVGMGPKSIRIQKKLMQTWENSTVDEGIQAGVEAFGEAYSDGGKEPKEYMGTFINRRR